MRRRNVCISTMPLDRKVVLLAILTFINVISIPHVNGSKVLTLSDESDDENTLRQALYLVKLLKSDYIKSLRENSDLELNDEANSTCPEDALNATTTTAYGSIGITENTPPAMQPPVGGPLYAVNQLAEPSAPAAPPLYNSGLPSATYPPQPSIQYPSPGIMSPAENINIPYRQYHRRMMPDYAYYDVLLPRYNNLRRSSHQIENIEIAPTAVSGQYRRLNYDDPFYKPHSGINIQGQYRRQGYYDPTSEQPIILSGYRRMDVANPVINGSVGMVTETSTVTQLINSPEVNNTKPLKNAIFIKDTSPTVIRAAMLSSSSPTSVTNKTLTKTSASISPRPTKPTTKARPKSIKKTTRQNIRPYSATGRDNSTSQDIHMTQVATELLNEFKTNVAENMTGILRHNINPLKPKPLFTRSTLKIYLQGSSRIPIPFPENNAFCHLYPQSKLCGSGM